MSAPTGAPEWGDIFVDPFTVLIVGSRGAGKTATGHRLMEQFGGEDSDRDAYIMGFPEHRRDELPDWIDILPEHVPMDAWPENSVVLIHEAHHLLHARESMDAENLTVDKLVTVSRHKNSDIIFETQQTQRLDRNAVAAVDGVVVKWPALLQEKFERKQMRKIVGDALDVLSKYVTVHVEDDPDVVADAQSRFPQADIVTHDGGYEWVEKAPELVKHAYVFSERFRGEYPHAIDLAEHWTEEISKAYGDIPDGDGGGPDPEPGEVLSTDEEEALLDVAHWESSHRPLSFEHQGAEYSDTSARPHTLSGLEQDGLSAKVYDSSNKPNRYRLTDAGWDAIEVERPEEPLLAEEA